MLASNEEGLTLVELVVSVSLLLFVMAGLYQTVSLGISAWKTGEQSIDVQQNVCIAASAVSRELRTASYFKVKDGDRSISMRIPDRGEITYYLHGQQLQRDVNGQGHNIVAYGIRSVTFLEIVKDRMVFIEVEGATGYKIRTQVGTRMNQCLP